MELRINNVRISLVHEKTLEQAVAKKIGLRPQVLGQVRVLRRAVDARHKKEVCLNYHVVAQVDLPAWLRPRVLALPDVTVYEKAQPLEPLLGTSPLGQQPVVIGAGPAGLLAALELAKYGYKPLLLERGKPVAERVADVAAFWRQGVFNPDSNVQFGEGGAGTFSDGKLTTRVNDPVMADILAAFVAAGAPAEILTEQKPHVGTDKLRAMVRGLTRQIKAYGGTIRYQTQVRDFIFKEGRLTGLVLPEGVLPVQVAVLACGHSARDTYEALAAHQVALEAKAFAIGLRVEHPQQLIDRAMYGDFAGHPLLGPADYQFIYHTPDKARTAYSFCMCPGGQVVGAASECGGVVVNGMSLYGRDSGVANSALVVNVGPGDFGGEPLAGVAFQRRYEQLAFVAGGKSYAAPAQTVDSYLQGTQPVLTQPESTILPSYLPKVVPYALEKVLPPIVTSTLQAGLHSFARRVPGFDGPEGVLTGVETRTSSPLRIRRGPDYLSRPIKVFIPAGKAPAMPGAS